MTIYAIDVKDNLNFYQYFKHNQKIVRYVDYLDLDDGSNPHVYYPQLGRHAPSDGFLLTIFNLPTDPNQDPSTYTIFNQYWYADETKYLTGFNSSYIQSLILAKYPYETTSGPDPNYKEDGSGFGGSLLFNEHLKYSINGSRNLKQGLSFYQGVWPAKEINLTQHLIFQHLADNQYTFQRLKSNLVFKQQVLITKSSGTLNKLIFLEIIQVRMIWK